MSDFPVKSCPVCSSDEFSAFISSKDYFVTGQEFQIVTCRECGLKITQNAPGEKDIGKYYQSENYISHSDTSSGLVNMLYHRVRNYMLGRKRKLVEKESVKGHVLDVGTGTGYFLQEMKEHGWEVSGTEKSPAAREFCRKEFGLEIHPVEELFRFRKESFDVITLWHVLEHIHDINENMKVFFRLLKPDGKLVIALPNYTSLDARHYKASWAAWDVPRHLWHFAPDQMEKFGKKHNFLLKKIHPMPFDSFYVSMLSEKYRKSHLAFIKGMVYGNVSLIRSMINPSRGSSVIYVFKKSGLF
jgi:2-polyprenyl-3-methyl-5-hydroxy-6-metoxy-1,4-benzoquinol methylase